MHVDKEIKELKGTTVRKLRYMSAYMLRRMPAWTTAATASHLLALISNKGYRMLWDWQRKNNTFAMLM